jgi:hypothetical protein
MNLLERVRKLCTPAYLYLVISVVAIIAMMLQNVGNTDKYCLGVYECNVQSTALVFVVQLAYVAFWTFVLNALCQAGYRQVSWFLVLLPFILFFVLLGLMILSQVRV